MELTTDIYITLDLYRKCTKVVKAKQDDIGRRIIVSCTDNGKKFLLDDTITARVEIEKPDGHNIFNDCTVSTEDNEVYIDLTEQMLASPGIGKGCLMLANSESLSILHTMDFVLIVEKRVIENEASVISEDECDSLRNIVLAEQKRIKEMNEFETMISGNEADRISNENTRKSAENNRVSSENERRSNENTRVSNESSRVSNEKERVSKESDRLSAEKQRIENEKSRVSEEQKRADAEQQRVENENNRIEIINQAKQCIDRVDEIFESTDGKTAAEAIKSKVDVGDLVKDVDIQEDGKVMDGKTCSEAIIALQNRIRCGTEDPDNSVGVDGDIYVKIVE